MYKEELIKKFNELYNSLTLRIKDEKEIYDLREKINVSCNKCNHSWETSIKNALVFHLGCYECHKGKGYSMDEIKILKYLKDNYFPNDLSFRHAETGGQLIIRPKPPKFQFVHPMYYSCDGFSRRVYQYNKETKELQCSKETCAFLKGTVFEVLGDYHHSNPLYYKPNDISPREGMTHKQNFEYTMNRIKHIEEQGYKVFYIWISDFRRFSRDLEKGNPNIFDYMNIEKKYTDEKPDYSLVYKGTKKFICKSKNYVCKGFEDFEL